MKNNHALYLRQYRRTIKGVLIYLFSNLKQRLPTEYTVKTFQERFLNDPRYIRLYNEWVKSGYQQRLKPSIDRIDHNKNYTVKNTHILTWEENVYKAKMEKRNLCGPVLQLKDGKVINRYLSQRDAYMKTGIRQNYISASVCASSRGKIKPAGGYVWKWESLVRHVSRPSNRHRNRMRIYLEVWK